MRMIALTATFLAITSMAAPADSQPIKVDCVSDYYTLADGSGVDIARSDGDHFRWRRPDGTTGLLSKKDDGLWYSTLGWTGRSDGVVVDMSGCADGQIRFNGYDGKRLNLVETESQFAVDGADLAGRLVLPVGTSTVPVVVLVHGSEDSSALASYALQRLLPAQGIGVFVYDKRGTGSSTGTFTHDIHQLARDAVAASRVARSMAGERAGRIGYYGTSQGGWTAPLAAEIEPVDFVIVGYGLAVTPFDEDNEAIELDMSRHGFGAEETAKALEIGAAAQEIIRSGFVSGYSELHALVAKYRQEPWFTHLRGNVTGIVINLSEADLRELGPLAFAGVRPDYDPMPVLRNLDIGQLWILGAQDIDAPYMETYRRLMHLRQTGRPISLVVYPDVEHQLYAFESTNSVRLSTRQPASLQRLIATFARGEALDPCYDNALVEP